MLNPDAQTRLTLPQLIAVLASAPTAAATQHPHDASSSAVPPSAHAASAPIAATSVPNFDDPSPPYVLPSRMHMPSPTLGTNPESSQLTPRADPENTPVNVSSTSRSFGGSSGGGVDTGRSEATLSLGARSDGYRAPVSALADFDGKPSGDKSASKWSGSRPHTDPASSTGSFEKELAQICCPCVADPRSRPSTVVDYRATAGACAPRAHATQPAAPRRSPPQCWVDLARASDSWLAGRRHHHNNNINIDTVYRLYTDLLLPVL